MSKHGDRDDPDGGDDRSAALRIDKWLWFARFFKSRSLATDAVTGGLVHLNGERIKPARDVHLGDTLFITRGEQRFEVIVRGLPTRRGPAIDAQRAYEETQASIDERARKREHARLSPPTSLGRPDKHERRALRSLRGR